MVNSLFRIFGRRELAGPERAGVSFGHRRGGVVAVAVKPLGRLQVLLSGVVGQDDLLRLSLEHSAIALDLPVFFVVRALVVVGLLGLGEEDRRLVGRIGNLVVLGDSLALEDVARSLDFEAVPCIGED